MSSLVFNPVYDLSYKEESILAGSVGCCHVAVVVSWLQTQGEAVASMGVLVALRKLKVI